MKQSNKKKGFLPLLLILSISLVACQTPAAESTQGVSSTEESSYTQSLSEESSSQQDDGSLEESSSPEDDGSSAEDSSSQSESSSPQDSSSLQEHEHTPMPDDNDCTTPILCACSHVITAGSATHVFDNACDKTCNNAGCSHTRSVAGHADKNNDGKCDYCNADVPKQGGVELPEDTFH